jgi:hypothetical protein
MTFGSLALDGYCAFVPFVLSYFFILFVRTDVVFIGVVMRVLHLIVSPMYVYTLSFVLRNAVNARGSYS